MKITNPKKFIILIVIVTLIIAAIIGGVILWKKYKDNQKPENQPQVYEALVNVVDQKTGDPVEDARSSLKKGDVIAYFPAGHSWSDTEKNSYLIVKLKLKAEDAAKLMAAETKEIKDTEKSPDGKSSSPADGDIRPRTETVRARQYFLNLPKFDVQKFWETQQQPFGDKIFSESIIDKK